MKRLLVLIGIVVSAFSAARAQTTVTGKISHAQDGSLLQGVTVSLKDGRSLGISDVQGNFRVAVPEGTRSLIFSYVGFNDMEAVIGNGNLDIKMTEGKNKSLTEVIITGYASKSKRSSSGSAGTVTIDDIRTQPVASFDQLLQGQSTGVFVKTGTGQPGAASEILIRGRSSLSGSTNPLYILDGIEINAADFSTLNQNDFESVTILKDAAAASIYGSRAAGGVVVITSRRGKPGQLRINYDVQYGQSYWPEQKLKLMNTQEKLQYELDNGNPNGWTTSDIDRLSKINTDWQDILFRTGNTQSHQLSASGGNDKTRFFTSLSYLNQEGVVQATGIKRYTGRMNIESGTDKLRFGLNTSFGYSQFNNTNEGNQGIASPLNAIRWMLPYTTPYDDNGKFLQDPTVNGQPNPLQEILQNKRNFPQWKGIANAFAEYKIPYVQGLMIKTNWGFDYTQNESEVFLPKTTYVGQLAQGGQGSLARLFNRNFRYTGTNSVIYKNTFGDHDLAASVHQEIVKNDFRQFNFTGYGLTLPFENEASITDGTSTNGFIPTVRGAGTDNALVSYFTEADYGFKNKYFLHAGFRRDGSSRFGVNNKWANFYNVGASWILSDENFMGSLKNTFDLLKVKASYGTVGNQQGIGDFTSRALFGKVNYSGITGLGLTSPGNPDLRWEERATLNLGIEFGLLKNRISGSVEFYNSNTNDLFFQKTLSQTTGFASVLSNDGSLRNRGIEVMLRGQPVRSKNFTWSIDANFTYNKNTVTSLPEGQDNILQPDGISVLKTGKPANTLYLVKYAGVDPANGDPLYFKKDGKTITNAYSPDDNIYLGTSDAPYFGGLTNTFNYKGIELQVFWVYSIGNEIYNNDRFNVEYPAYIASSLSRDLLREWRNPGDITDIPRSDPSVYFLQNTTRFVESGSFMRLRNVQLSYILPKIVLQKIKINSLRVFVQGQNLYTYTKYRGFDPEIPPNGGTLNAGAQYPTLKTVTAGINIGF
jgi:TonB-dependent starch-binding outer membrane protein SusC